MLAFIEVLLPKPMLKSELFEAMLETEGVRAPRPIKPPFEPEFPATRCGPKPNRPAGLGLLEANRIGARMPGLSAGPFDDRRLRAESCSSLCCTGLGSRVGTREALGERDIGRCLVVSRFKLSLDCDRFLTVFE